MLLSTVVVVVVVVVAHGQAAGRRYGNTAATAAEMVMDAGSLGGHQRIFQTRFTRTPFVLNCYIAK
jgi:hypothetical protein